MKEYILFQRLSETCVTKKNNGKWGYGVGPYGTSGFCTKLYTLKGVRSVMTRLMNQNLEVGFIHKDELNKPFNSLSSLARDIKFA